MSIQKRTQSSPREKEINMRRGKEKSNQNKSQHTLTQTQLQQPATQSINQQEDQLIKHMLNNMHLPKTAKNNEPPPINSHQLKNILCQLIEALTNQMKAAKEYTNEVRSIKNQMQKTNATMEKIIKKIKNVHKNDEGSNSSQEKQKQDQKNVSKKKGPSAKGRPTSIMNTFNQINSTTQKSESRRGQKKSPSAKRFFERPKQRSVTKKSKKAIESGGNSQKSVRSSPGIKKIHLQVEEDPNEYKNNDLRKLKKIYPLDFKIKIIKERLVDGMTARQICHRHDLSVRTVQEWVSRYKKDNGESLADLDKDTIKGFQQDQEQTNKKEEEDNDDEAVYDDLNSNQDEDQNQIEDDNQ